LVDVEIIYINNNQKKIENLKPQVNISKNIDIKQKLPVKKVKSFMKRKKSKKFYVSLFSIFIIFTAALLTSYNAGFVPIDILLDIKEPSGVVSEVSYAKIKNYYPITESIPDINNIKHKIFQSSEEISVIVDNYANELTKEGYSLKYSGVKGIKGIDVHYYAYIKGITAAVILLTKEKLDIFNSNTLVLYSTGNVFSYKDIVNKYSNNLDL